MKVMHFKNLNDYEIVDVNLDAFNSEINSILKPGITEEEMRCSLTSPWMNRSELSSDGNIHYFIVPSITLGPLMSIDELTRRNFIVYKLIKDEYERWDVSPIEANDTKYVIEQIKNEFTEDRRLARIMKDLDSLRYGAYYQSYRRMFAVCADDVLEVLRNIVRYKPNEFKKLLKGIYSDDWGEKYIDNLYTDKFAAKLTLELRQAIAIGKSIFGQDMDVSKYCDLEKLGSDTKLQDTLLSAISPESIEIIREWVNEELADKQVIWKIKDIPGEFVKNLLFGFILYKDEDNTYSLYRKINKDSINDPFGVRVTEAERIRKGMKTQEEAIKIVSDFLSNAQKTIKNQ